MVVLVDALVLGPPPPPPPPPPPLLFVRHAPVLLPPPRWNPRNIWGVGWAVVDWAWSSEVVGPRLSCDGPALSSVPSFGDGRWTLTAAS